MHMPCRTGYSILVNLCSSPKCQLPHPFSLVHFLGRREAGTMHIEGEPRKTYGSEGSHV